MATFPSDNGLKLSLQVDGKHSRHRRSQHWRSRASGTSEASQDHFNRYIPMKTIAQQINWDFDANGNLVIEDNKNRLIYHEL